MAIWTQCCFSYMHRLLWATRESLEGVVPLRADAQPGRGGLYDLCTEEPNLMKHKALTAAIAAALAAPVAAQAVDFSISGPSEPGVVHR